MDLIRELNLTGERKGERALSLLLSAVIKDIQDIQEDENPKTNAIRLGLLGYETEKDRGRMN
jgi:hypothetical protein